MNDTPPTPRAAVPQEATSKPGEFCEFIIRRLRPGQAPIYESLMTTTDVDFANRLRALLVIDWSGTKTEELKNAKPLIVVAVDKEVHQRYCTGPGKNELRSLPVEPEQRFPSAVAAAKHLGVAPTQLHIALRRETNGKRDPASVRGVTLDYDEGE